MRIHHRVWLWWGRWWAVQFVALWDEVALGMRCNLRRPVLDLYLGPLTIAVGRHAVYTDERARYRDSCRGMLFHDDPHWPLPDADAVKARIL